MIKPSLKRYISLLLAGVLLADPLTASAFRTHNTAFFNSPSIQACLQEQALSVVLLSGELHFRQFFSRHIGRTFGGWTRKSRLREANESRRSALRLALRSQAEFVLGIFFKPSSLQTRVQRSLRVAFGVVGVAVLFWDVTHAIGSLWTLVHGGSFTYTGVGAGRDLLASLSLVSLAPDPSIAPLAKRPWALSPQSKPPLSSQPFYSRLLVGVGEVNPDWARRAVVAETILEAIESPGAATFALDEIRDIVSQKLIDQGLPLMGDQNEHLRRLMGSLEELEIVKKLKVGDRYRFARETETNINPKVVATKFKLVRYIGERLEGAVKAARTGDSKSESALFKMLIEYGEVAERWPGYPLESRWPFLEAATYLDKEDLDYLVEFVSTWKDRKTNRLLRDQYPLFDALWLMTVGRDPKVDVGEDWVLRQTPRVIGRNHYLITPEGWLPAGGLGRVIQFLSAGMARLTGKWTSVVTIEPYYIEDVTPEVAKKIIFVDKFELPLPGEDEPITLEVFKYLNDKGVEVGSSRVDLQACKLEYSIVSPK